MTEEDPLEKIKRLEDEIARLKQQCAQTQCAEDEAHLPNSPLTQDEFKRYGRQMIVDGFGSLEAQLKLKSAKVLVIGAGGLGCPALMYLGGCGIGEIGIVDNDIVDVSNLHRQVLHTTDAVGMLKCENAKRYINRLNPHVKVKTYPVRLSNDNAFSIIEQYDLVLDCTDSPAVRYLINDVSVILGKTIVSGSGVRSDAQLSILNYRRRGPCYRCFYPTPPTPESVSSCGDNGVIGPCIGLLGVSMCVEAIKVLTEYYDTVEPFTPFLTLYQGYPHQTFRRFKMRARQSKCVVCGDAPEITREGIESGYINYAVFCGAVQYNVCKESERVTVKELHENLSKLPYIIDVRPQLQFNITHLPESINIPWGEVFLKSANIDKYLPNGIDKTTDNVYIICRYGNDSQLATRRMIDEFGFENAKDVKGGINKWSETVDHSIPLY